MILALFKEADGAAPAAAGEAAGVVLIVGCRLRVSGLLLVFALAGREAAALAGIAPHAQATFTVRFISYVVRYDGGVGAFCGSYGLLDRIHCRCTCWQLVLSESRWFTDCLSCAHVLLIWKLEVLRYDRRCRFDNCD